MEIEWSERAKNDVINIARYIAETDTVENALYIMHRLENDVLQLKDFPFSGVFPKDKILKSEGYRMLVVEKFLVFYLLNENKVSIVAVIHGAQKYSYLTIK